MKYGLSDNHQEIREFIIEQKLNLADDKPICKAISNNFEIVQFIDYWLEKSKSIKNGDKLTEELLSFGTKDSEKFVTYDHQKWYQLLSELETFYLLHNKFGMNVVGYEQVPVGKKNKSPDFEIKLGNESVYFEVKFKASQVTQRIPQKLDEFLDKIEEEHGNKYRITLMEVENSEDRETCPNYQKLFSKYLLLPENLNIIEKEIKDHLNVLNKNKKLERKDRHSSRCIVLIKAGVEAIDIHFSIKLKLKNHGIRISCFRPDNIYDIKSWLFEEQEGKTPMVKEAESKGADYLVCFIPFWEDIDETFYDYVTPLFSDIQKFKPNITISRDVNLRNLSGVILMSQKGSLTNNHVIVSNANITPKIKDWLDIVPCH